MIWMLLQTFFIQSYEIKLTSDSMKEIVPEITALYMFLNIVQTDYSRWKCYV